MKRFFFTAAAAVLAIALALALAEPIGAGTGKLPWMDGSVSRLEKELVAKYGEGQRAGIRRGLGQVAGLWRSEDGDEAVFEGFVRANFAGDKRTRDAMFDRFESHLERLYGYMLEIGHEFRLHAELDRGPILPFDIAFAGYNPSAHVTDDLFDNKLAFTVLLNFPLTTLEQRLKEGEGWTRRQWAEARLAQNFSKRVPADVKLAVSMASAEAERYIAGYNVWMHHLVDDGGSRLFPPGMRLLSHWNLRDEIKANYSGGEEGLAKQRMIQKVMERIVTQTIPQVVIDNPHVDWNPFTNEVEPAAVKDAETAPPQGMKVSGSPEPDTRYSILLNTFLAARKVDPYSPSAPTLIARRFDENREIPEARVREMLERVVSSPVVARVAELIRSRLGRPLEPFDIWYNGFRPMGEYKELDLDRIVSEKYPTPEAFREDIPDLLAGLGFGSERADRLAGDILVEAARGSGHAWGASMRGQKVRLRTRISKKGMDYKGFNIAVHELGHNVEQLFSINDVDYTQLSGVPNTAFTEAVAFVFQSRDLGLLGLETPSGGEFEALKTLDDFWGTYEISAVALVDMAVWHWMYENPKASPSELKEAVIRIAKDLWNEYFAPVFGKKDVLLLGIYSHMIDSFLYLPDYPIGQLIAAQIEDHISGTGSVGSEVERMTKLGRISPDLWMQNATGSPVGAEAMLAAVERAVREIEGAK